MTKKTKFEKSEGMLRQPLDHDPTQSSVRSTDVKFTPDEVRGFIAGTNYAAFRKQQYLERVLSRPPNPRLNEKGEEVLSPHSVVADIDLQPLTTRQNISRFMASDLVNGDGFDDETDTDAEGRPIYDDRDYYVPDRTDEMPSPHELRAHHLSKKLSDVRQKVADDAADRRRLGETPTHKEEIPNENPPPVVNKRPDNLGQ